MFVFKSSILVGVCLLSLVWVGAPVHAQMDRFEDETQVIVVEVPVHVIRKGEPVRNLTAADFVVRDDGKRQELLDFRVIDLTAPEAQTQPTTQVPVAARRHFLLLFDLSFSDPTHIERARLAGMEVVTRALHPSDLVGVATYSASRGASLVLGFTPDRNQVQQALAALSVAQPLRHYQDPLALTVGDTFDPGHPYKGGGGAENNKAERYDTMLENYRDLSAFAARSQREQREADVLALTSSLEEFGGLMRGVAGRKHVVLLSEGFDSSIVVGTENWDRTAEISGDSMRGEVWRVDSEERFGSSLAKKGLNQAMEEFRRADCVIHTVDIGGLRATGDQDPRIAGQNGLFLMADQTGGEFFRNFNDLGEAMEGLLETTGVTYMLAFQPSSLTLDGRFHKINVRLADNTGGARIIHRPGYYAPRPFTELSGPERRIQTAGLIIGGREGGDFSVAVLATPFEGEDSKAYVPVLLEVDGPGLLVGQDSEQLSVELYAYAISRSGEIRDFFAQTLNLDLAKVAAILAKSGVKFWGQFELPPDDYIVRYLVRNATTGAMALRMIELRVPELANGEAGLLPPLVPEPADRWLMARQTSTPLETANPYLSQGKPFVPAGRPIVRRGSSMTFSLVAYNLGEGPLKASAELFRQDGSLAASPKVKRLQPDSTTSSGYQTLSAEIEGFDLEPGEYELVITAADPHSEATESSRLPIVVSDQS